MGEYVLKCSICPCRYKINLYNSYHSYLFISAPLCVSVSPLWLEMVSVRFPFEVPSEMICPIRSEELHPPMVAHGYLLLSGICYNI